MKKIALAFALAVLGAANMFADDLYMSSNVVVNQTARVNVGRGVLKRIIVGSPGTASSIQLWDGTNATTFLRKIGNFDTSTGAVKVMDFDVYIGSGLVYTTVGSADLSLIYKLGK